MEVMLAKKKKMSELIAPFHFYPQELRSLPVCDKHKAATAPEVLAAVEQACGALEGKGRALLRPSGTEDVLRLMVEAPDAQTCHAHAHAIENVLRREGYMR